MSAVAVTEPPAAPAALATLPAQLLRHARERPDVVAMREKHRGVWRETTWAEYARAVARCAAGLIELGVQPGDRVAIHSEGRPEWVIADLAIQGIGAISVGVYPTSPAAEVEYLLSHSGTKVLIAEDEEQVDKADAVRERCPDLEHVVVVDPQGVRDTTTWEQLLGGAEIRAAAADFARRVGELDPAATAIIVYTSGTTGPPKGAMLSHANLVWAADRFEEAWGASSEDEVLSYLPLCHVAERLGSVVNAVHVGYVVNFGEGGASFTQDLRDVQPTLFLGVPRVWEKMLATVEIKMGDASRIKRASYRAALKSGNRLVADALALRALRYKLGMSRIRAAVSGAAPIAPQVLEFFRRIGVPVREGYGMTENTAVCTWTPADDVRVGLVGKALPGVELRIADDGEILTRSRGTFQGYYRNEQATAETIDTDGWLHTGDVGELDGDGFLRITDRKKDIIITAGGKNISPSEIENKLKVSPYVREAIVIGDKRKYLTALIGIESDTVGDWATRKGLAYTTYADLSSQGGGAGVDRRLGQRGQRRPGAGGDDQEVRPARQGARPRGRRADGDDEGAAQGDGGALRDADRTALRHVTEFLQLCFAGTALGARYALVALGFVIIYRATGVINFAQGGLLLLGAYLSYAFANSAALPFVLAVVLAVACAGAIGASVERVVLRRMIGQPVFAVIMITIGLLFIIQQTVTSIWGYDTLNLNDPWGVDTTKVGGVVMAEKDLWTIGLAAAVLAGFFVFFRYSKLGVAMRAVAFDPEAALAQGISARRVFAVSWGISASLAAIAGVTLASGPAALSPGIDTIALIAFPAMIVGGLDSPHGRRAGRPDHRPRAVADFGLPGRPVPLAGAELPGRHALRGDDPDPPRAAVRAVRHAGSRRV